ncbi:P-loop containing nucleoside triphosphate hydrolase protein [Bisporella sp. PMI_857]|nr:P-loop containing nucleoside triphosphate hydrolase protein [Bisporella sp. PMI_857]
MLRGTLVTAIYQKTTEISITALDNSAAVTLMSTDVERIVVGFKQVHEFWANFIQVGLATWLLQRELGVACVAPIGIAILAAAAALGASGPAAKRQGIWMKALQKRVGITSTMLSSMKGVKMAGLTDKLASIIQTLRLDEITSASRFRWVVFYSVVIAFAPLHISPVVTFATFTGISNGSLNTATMFTSISLLGLLSSPLSMVFQSIPNFMAAINCFQRIQKYLETETKSDHRLKMQELLQDVSATSEDDRSMNLGDDIELIGLTPPTQTAHPVPQDQEVIGIRNGSFGWKPDEEPILRDINLSIKSSQLTMIIGAVASGKSTLLKALLGETTSTQGFVYVSSKEVAFCDQSPWLINGSVQKNILGFATFDGPWYNAVLHASGLEEDLASFPMGDQTQIGSKGITLSGGQKQRVAIARAVYSKKGIVIMDDVFSGMDATTEDLVFHRLLGPDGLLRRSKSTVILATHAVNLLPLADYIVALGSDGGILEQGAFDHLNAMDGYVRSFSVQQGKRKSEIEESPGKRTLEPLSASPLMDAMDEKKRQLGDMAVYMYYFKSIGILPTLLFFAYSVIFSFFSTFPTVWLKWWSDSETKHPNQSTAKYMGVYSVLEISTLAVLALLCWHTFMQINPKSGRQLHWITLRTVASAPMSLFSMVDTGVLVNRFSQDMELIDGELPMAGLNFSVAIFICLGQAILIATATFYIALAYPFIAFVFYLVQKYYLRTSRQLRFMDLEAKSPLYTQFIESLSGLSTIRAFGWQQNERDLNLLLLDTSQRPFYLLLMIQRWLSLVLDLVCVALALIVTGLAVKLRDVVSPGFTGVALINIIEFNLSLQGLVMWWTNLETSIGAVSRVRTFSEVTPTEALPQEITPPPQNWPLHGAIKLKNVSASYNTTGDDNLALNNISLSILPGEKLGICGRSGSGKSSFILALFRMMEISSGSILIDDIDLSTLPRQQIRGRLNVISQDPYFIAGSIRLNLDPYEASSDELIISALHKVQLHTTITSLGGLDTELDVDSLSHGQRQLFCLARAILRQSKIIVLDEATSSVDRKTDELMQRVIREEFAGCTVVAVAHRLETILNFDRILVLERGAVKECDTPAKLLAQDSAFKELYDIYSSSSKEVVEEL